MKQLGNLAIVCARRHDVVLIIQRGTVTVHVNTGESLETMTAEWQDDAANQEIVSQLNFGKYAERKD